MGFNQAPALPYRNLGIVEDGDTASQAIEKDKYVIWKGGNYFAKTDILQGETFVVDTNLTDVTEGAINGLANALNKWEDITDQVVFPYGTIVYGKVYKNNEAKIVRLIYCTSSISNQATIIKFPFLLAYSNFYTGSMKIGTAYRASSSGTADLMYETGPIAESNWGGISAGWSRIRSSNSANESFAYAFVMDLPLA